MAKKTKAPKPPKRVGRRIDRPPVPTGDYLEGVNAKVAASIGNVIVQYAHLEEDMVPFLSDLLGDADLKVTRPLFYSLFGAQGRSRVMRALLENSSINKEKDDDYDWVLKKFDEVTVMRNKVAHCLWFLHAQTNEHYAASPNGGDFGIPLSAGGERWTAEKFTELLMQMSFLRRKVRAMHEENEKRRIQAAG
jgi:hypothetical protein